MLLKHFDNRLEDSWFGLHHTCSRLNLQDSGLQVVGYCSCLWTHQSMSYTSLWLLEVVCLLMLKSRLTFVEQGISFSFKIILRIYCVVAVFDFKEHWAQGNHWVCFQEVSCNWNNVSVDFLSYLLWVARECHPWPGFSKLTYQRNLVYIWPALLKELLYV